jgi:hypothetical protein
MTDLGRSITEDIIYTLVKNLRDFGNISYGDIELSKTMAEETYEKITGKKVTIKKQVISKATPKKSIPFADIKQKPRTTGKKEIVWVDYVNDEEHHYGYTTQISFLDGQFPIYDFSTNKVVGAIGQGTGPRPLTLNDKKILVVNQLEFVDF